MALTKVSSSLVSDNAITTGKLVDGGVHSADIATNAITSTKIAQNSILTKHIDDGQVTTSQLGADAVTAAKIADDAISEEHLDVTVITGLTEVTAATGDLLMVADISDSNNLKKIPVSSILAGTLTTAAQTNITSVGTLTGLTVSGATNINNALTVKNNYNETKFIRNADVSSVGAAGHYLSIGALNSGSVVTPNVISGVTDTDGTSSSFALMQDGANSLSFNSSKNATFAGTISSGAITSTSDITTNSTTHAYMVINSSATNRASWLWHKQGSTARWLSGVEGSESDWQLYSTNSGNTGTRLRVTADGNATFAGTISSGAITSSSSIRANDWYRGASNTNTLFSNTSQGTIIQTPSNTNNAAGTFFIRDSLGAVHFSLNTNTNASSFHGGTISSGAITSTGLIKTTGDIEIASSQPRLHLDRSDGAYSWNIYNGNGSGNFPNSTFNIANNAGTPVITALDSGDVGIGTTSPATPLHVRNVGNPNSGGNRNTVETVLTLDSTGHYPYTGYGVGIDFKGEDYGNTALREYAKIQAVMTDSANQNASGDPSFRSALTFWTNTGGASNTTATEKMRISSAGNVGIRNTNPAATLEVGTLTSGSTGNVIINSEGGNPPALQVKSRTNRARINVQDNDTSGYIIAEGSVFSFGFADAVSDNNININTSHNVGIGTDTPTTKLHIQNNTSTVYDATAYQHDLFIEKRNTAGNNQVGSIRFAVTGHDGSTTAEASIGVLQTSNAHSGNLVFGTRHSGTRAERMRIRSDGNVGIGTTDPAQLFEVSGNAKKSRFTRSGSAGNLIEYYYGGTHAGGISVSSAGLGISEGSGEDEILVRPDGNLDANAVKARMSGYVQNMFHIGSDKHAIARYSPKSTYVDGTSSNYQGYVYGQETYIPPVFVPYSPHQVYRLSASIHQLTNATGGTDSRHYIGLAGYDENFNFLSVDGIGTFQYNMASNAQIFAGNSLEVDITIKGWQGSGGSNGNKMDEGTVYIRPLILFNYQRAGGTTVLTGFNIQPAGTIADNDSNAGTNY